jgi:hypothetical protein
MTIVVSEATCVNDKIHSLQNHLSRRKTKDNFLVKADSGPALSAARKGWVGLSDASPIPAQAPPLPAPLRPGSGDSMQKKI